MSTLTDRGANANTPARLPSLQAARAQDQNVQRALEAVREWLEVRLGARGDRYERAVTFRDLDPQVSAITARLKALEGVTAAVSAASEVAEGTGSSAEVQAALQAALAQIDAALVRAVAQLQAQALAAADGDHGDITISDSGAAYTIDAGVVTNSKLAAVATKTIKGRTTAGTGAPEDLTAAQTRSLLGETVSTLTDGPNIAVDASLANNFRVTLGGNRTLDNPTNLIDGQSLHLRVIQDGVGSRTLAYGSKYKWPAGVAPTLSTAASAVDFMSCQYDATSDTLLCVMTKAFA